MPILRPALSTNRLNEARIQGLRLEDWVSGWDNHCEDNP
ncbi:hypothetical protein RS9917_12910 [Synechococcus sp. RS9917]|nr:hypothetical protein RS9917_12910 [Synechococcus sp. RS9917]